MWNDLIIFLFILREIINDDQNFGGIVGFTREQFERVNGFSNLFFGYSIYLLAIFIVILSNLKREREREPSPIFVPKRYCVLARTFLVVKISWRFTVTDLLNELLNNIKIDSLNSP